MGGVVVPGAGVVHVEEQVQEAEVEPGLVNRMVRRVVSLLNMKKYCVDWTDCETIWVLFV